MNIRLLFIVALAVFLCLPNATFAQAPNLGATSSFALFTAIGAFNGDVPTTVVGNIGTNAGAFTPPGTVVGSIHVADPLTAMAAADVSTAYGYLAGLTCGSVLTTPLGNAQTLAPNIYCIGTAAVLNATLILDGGGNPGAIFIFQINGALSTNPFSSIALINGANVCNVYFQINGALNIGGNSLFQGTAIVAGAINLANGATLIGRGLSTAGAISTSANSVTLPAACANALPPPSITCPSPVTVSCANLVPAASTTAVSATATCPGPVTITFTGDVITNQTCANRFTIIRTYRATDACGVTATCSQSITVNDQTTPSITCPAAITVQCASLVPAANPAAVTAADNCGGGAPVVTFVGDVITNQTCANRFTITRTYRATDACGFTATCSQSITVNDQTPPSITCPAAVTVQCASLVPAASTASVTVGTDNCGGTTPTVTFVSDVITNQTCANRFTITRTYRVTDACGNTATCIQIITVFDNTAPIFDNPPANVTVECLLVPAIPTPTATDNCTGPVTVVFLGEIQTPGVCPVLYTLTRTWRATDACGNSKTITQVVTVRDTQPPQFINIPVNVVLECNLNTNPDSLQNWIANHGGATAFDCSAITWTTMNISFLPGCGGTFQRFIRFIATDACGNSSFRDARFTVIDLTPPVFTVPPQNLAVECMPDGNGDAQLLEWVEHFGNAQVTDVCGSVTTSLLFLSEIPLCGNTFRRTYQFRATDECGNTNYVTATFAVVDTTPPVIVKCPPGALLTCVDSVPGPDLAGVMATDNCGSVKITATTFTTGTGCKNSPMTVSYWYMATDECGNMVSNCDQSFQIVDTIAPFYNGPDTIYVACIADLPTPTQVMSLLMPYMVDNCYNFICVGHIVGQNGSNSITYTMVGKDFCGNLAAEFTVTFIAIGSCKAFCTAGQATWGNPAATISGNGTTGVIEQLINQFGGVMAGGPGKTLIAGSAECLQNMLPGAGTTAPFGPGNYAGNNCLLLSKFLNNDGTLKNQLAANVMAMQLNIWYNLKFNDRNLGIQQLALLPPCLVNPSVLAKLETGHLTVQGLLDLSNDYLAGVGFFAPNFGNLLNEALTNLNNYWQSCQANPSNPCPSSIPNATVAGAIKTEAGFGLEEANVDVTGYNQTDQYTMFNISSETGIYSFLNAIPIASNATITPTKDNNPLNGVSTYDLVLISRHILGLEPLNSPYKMIAADANRSGSITTFDIVELRKLILGIYPVLPNNTSWRFVDWDYIFPNMANPFQTQFPENKTLAEIYSSQMDQDFVAVKIGDVNQSVIANTQQHTEDRAMGTLLLDVEDRTVQAGEAFDLTFRTAEPAPAYQFTLNLEGLTVTGIANGDKISAENFGVFQGALTASINGAQEFTVRFHASKAGRISNMLSLSGQITPVEAYTLSGERQELALRFRSTAGLTTHPAGFELYQNVPNPFEDQTTIGFFLPEGTATTLTLYDGTGRMVYTRHGEFASGYNTITIDGASVISLGSGLLYYKLETATDMAIRKMVQLK